MKLRVILKERRDVKNFMKFTWAVDFLYLKNMSKS